MAPNFDANIFITDIKKNLKRWTTKGKSIFYLTKSYWYQFRIESGKICAFRQSIKTYSIERAIMPIGNFPIGSSWLKEPRQTNKRNDNFFSFITDLRG